MPRTPPKGHTRAAASTGDVSPAKRDSPPRASGVHPTVTPSSERAALWEGRYRIGAELGRGATSVLHEAEDTVLGRNVVVQELWGTAAPPGILLAQEARALAAVDHPSVVAVYGVYPDSDPPFLVMERASGRALSFLLAERRLAIKPALSILRQVAAGIDAIHAAGLVHGDVCPSNVVVDDDGGVKIVEVGVAAFVARMSPGNLLGTPAYMAPERAHGSQSPSGLTSRGDVYSFGVLCFQMLTGRLPFLASSASEMLRAHVHQRPPMPSQCAGLSTEFDGPLAAALAKRPEQRIDGCTRLVDALEHASHGADAAGRRLRVLVADDDEGQRMLLMSVLGAYLPGASIVLCASGRSALEAAEAQPSIAVLDLGMPEPAGMELVQKLRERSPKTTIVIVTGRGTGVERSLARDLGVRRFVVKPFEVDELVLAIRDAASAEEPSVPPVAPDTTGRGW